MMSSDPHGPEHTDRLARWEHVTEWHLVVVGVLFAAAWAIPIVHPELSPLWRRILTGVEIAAWAIFALDYVVRLTLARQRWRFFYTNILSLLIVVMPLFAPLRAMRIMLVLSMLARRVRLPLRTRAIVYMCGAGVFLTLIGALAVLDVERADGNGEHNIKTVGDALWWSITTIATVGFGDLYPVTDHGRVIAGALMVSGIALAGVVTAAIASWFVEKFEEADQAAKEARAQVLVLTEEVRALRERLEPAPADPGLRRTTDP